MLSITANEYNFDRYTLNKQHFNPGDVISADLTSKRSGQPFYTWVLRHLTHITYVGLCELH